ncbi:MAG: MBL fold metallo-hydrolase [bacterium]|nr:MBL fold metallo-hydrolase [bacterium]
MIITWYGQACFKIQSGETIIAIDPFAKEIGLTPPRFRSDVALVTHGHPDHANVETLAGEPFLINGPGEYERAGVNVVGIETYHDAVRGAERGLNTIYMLVVEDIHIVHLGDFGEGVLRDETLEAIGEADILMIPVGGVYTIDAEQAARVVKQVEPRIVIPMHYKLPGLTPPLESVERFLKEMGASKAEPQEKLVIKKKDLKDDESKTHVIVLASA